MIHVSQEMVETQNSENSAPPPPAFPKSNLTCEACLPSSGKKIKQERYQPIRARQETITPRNPPSLSGIKTRFYSRALTDTTLDGD